MCFFPCPFFGGEHIIQSLYTVCSVGTVELGCNPSLLTVFPLTGTLQENIETSNEYHP